MRKRYWLLHVLCLCAITLQVNAEVSSYTHEESTYEYEFD